jgi:hypothetical protein
LKKCVNSIKIIILNFLEGAQKRTNVWFALCKNCSLNNMDVGHGSSLRLLGFVCVFALVFTNNVAMVK